MLRKIFYVTLVSVLVLFLFGCKQGEINTSVYTQDLIDVTEEKSEIMVNTDVTFPVPSEKWFSKNKEELRGILTDYFTTKGEFEIVQSGMNTMVETQIKVPFFYAAKGSQKEQLPLLSYFIQKTERDTNKVGFLIHPKVLKNLKRRVDSEFPMGSFEMKNFDLILTIRNTMREDFTFDASDIYIDGKPIYLTSQVDEMTIEPREKKEIQISKLLMNSMLYYKEATSFMEF